MEYEEGWEAQNVLGWKEKKKKKGLEADKNAKV